MDVEISDFEAGYEIPDDASGAILLLPLSVERTIDGEKYVVYASSATSLLKVLKANSIAARLAPAGGMKVAYQENRSFDWFAPTILITASLIAQNPLIVGVAINVISSYVYDLFKGRTPEPSTRCTFAYVGNGKRKKVHYEGPVSGLSRIPQIIKEIHNGENNVP